MVIAQYSGLLSCDLIKSFNENLDKFTNKLVYKINSDFPFSGQALEYYEEPKTEIRTDANDKKIFLAAVIKSKINFTKSIFKEFLFNRQIYN